MRIQEIDLKIIYNSLGDETLEATINGVTASCPAGTSKSRFEAKILAANRSLDNFKKIENSLIKHSFENIDEFDSILRKYFPRLGATATTALSLAFYSAIEKYKKKYKTTSKKLLFPMPLGNIIGGGSHVKRSGMSIQEIIVIPVKAKTFPNAIKTNFAIWKEIGEELSKKHFTALNYESAWISDINDEIALDLAEKVAKRYKARLGIDIAASQLYKKGKYWYESKALSKESQIDNVIDLIKLYNLIYVEDPMNQDDFEGFAEIRKSSKALICGDDIISTNISRFQDALANFSINSVIVKPNQTGFVSDSIKIIEMAKSEDVVPVVSHRSGETPDVSICRLARLAPMAKFGIAGIRTIKLNELLRQWYIAKKPKLAKVKL